MQLYSCDDYKLASKKYNDTNTVVHLGYDTYVGDNNFLMCAGPCSIEKDNYYNACKQVVEAGANLIRGGAYKPRTSPYSFQGLGIEGLDIMVETSQELGVPCVTEVTDAKYIDLLINKGINVLQVGARNSNNFTLLSEVGKTRMPVILKRGTSQTIEELLMAAEYILKEGNPNVVLCERGIRTFCTYTRNTFDANAIPALHELTHLPVIADPSHATGSASLIEPIALCATAAGADGLMIEVHTNPSAALSDANQQILPTTFKQIVDKANKIRQVL